MLIARDLDKLDYSPKTKREVAMEEEDCYYTCSRIKRDMIAVYETGVVRKSGCRPRGERVWETARRKLTQNDDSEESTDDSESFVEEPPVEEPPVIKYQLRKPHVSKVRDYNYPLNLMLRRYIRSLQIFC